MGWLILTLLSAFTLSVSRILQRVLLRGEKSDSFAFSFVFPLLVSIVIFGYLLVTSTLEFPDLSAVILNIILMIIFYSIGSICVYYAYKQSSASEVSIIFASSSVWSVLSAVWFLGENLLPKNIVGIVAIVAGLVVLNYQKSRWKLEKGHLYAMVRAIFFGVAFTNDAVIIQYYDSAPPYVFLAFVLPALAILAYRPKLVMNIPYFFSKKMLGKFLLTAATYALSAIAIYSAYKVGGKASIITPIQQINIVLTVIFGYFLLNEREKLIQKFIGSTLAFFGCSLVDLT
ncbi:TPA: hypothetical protein DD448_03950 [Candidatus Collierbacteria bacterium]|nr:hypothetical protein [Candidatus Collierbacteria bacterium]